MDEVLVKKMFEERKRFGTSFRDLADRYGGTHEAIRLAFQQFGLPTARQDKAVRRTNVWGRKNEIFGAYRRLGSIDKVAAELGLPRREVGAVIRTMPLRNSFRHTAAGRAEVDAGHQSSFNESDWVAAIQVCARDLGHEPSYSQYLKWREEHPDAPSGPTIRALIGWSAAVVRALDK